MVKSKKTEGRELEEGGENNEKKGRTLPSMIKNKGRRSAVHAKLNRDKKIEKRNQAKSRDVAIKRALDLGDEATPPFPF